ncbi:hypothetical protein SDRG_04080 [Saprolegnia diclina VS20]|uniref:EF-hand domain-containing protein n=1 Tax=Saprolegnia diclina (strain VS20) TaxID=1156394 RepID=T0QUK1_SAPDV|nr:hypothetical protein SDRG_04080 [Saprolegnia diclina VS20]EQC38366.1 hypothetical protein SDRG_04080 [Saprolegnia diclina VS20]|eukprot:XP_008607958.1 hypothetical protein SDRG_04080 [Saprolegnia diclina VS20]
MGDQHAPFTPSVTPRPIKPSQAPSPRKARMLATKAPIVSPIKVSASLSLNNGDPYPEEPPPRVSKLKMAGEMHAVRNLASHIHFGNTARSGVGEIVKVFESHGIHLTTDEAKTLLCEYEENNDEHLDYRNFVESFATMLRSKEAGKRIDIKKQRLQEHMKRIHTFQSAVVDDLHELLKERLQSSWISLKDSFKALDHDKSGLLAATDFLKVLKQYDLPVSHDILVNLMLRFDTNGDGFVNYTEFLSQFGAKFSNANPHGVGSSILQHTAHDFSVAAVEEKVQRAFLQGQVRKLVDDKIGPSWSKLREALVQHDHSKGGFVSRDDLQRLLARFHIELHEAQFQQLVLCYDTSRDGSVNTAEFFRHFGEDLRAYPHLTLPMSDAESKPKKFVLTERTSLLMCDKSSHSDRPNIKDHFSKLSDAQWHALYLDFVAADTHKTGWIPRAQFLSILCDYLGHDLPHDNVNAIFRACGSYVNDLMNYRDLVKAYRPQVMGIYAPHPNKNTMNAPKQNPTEYYNMESSIHNVCAALSPDTWQSLKSELIAADVRRIGRISADTFSSITKTHIPHLRDDQMAFLVLFYEDKANTHHTCSIRYSSFLTDYDHEVTPPSREVIDPIDEMDEWEMHEPTGRRRQPAPSPLDATRNVLKQNLHALEAALLLADADLKGIVSLETWLSLLKDHGVKVERKTPIFDSLFGRFINPTLGVLKYRELLLDLDAGVQAKQLVDTSTMTLLGDEKSHSSEIRSIDDARVVLRHHLTSSPALQRRVYKLFTQVDTARSGLLPYVDVRRVLEKIGIPFADAELFGAFAKYFDVDGSGFVPYLQMLHACGGKDPDKMSGMSDLASNCSYYSAISNAPRAVAKRSSQHKSVSVDAAAHAVVNRHVEEGQLAVGGAVAVEEKIKALLTKRWKTLHKAFQSIDSEKSGLVSQAAFRKVMENIGVALTFEESLRICKKYDTDNSGRLNYNVFLKQHVHGKNPFSEYTPLKPYSSDYANLPALSPSKSPVPEDIRSVLKLKWKSVYASLRKLDTEGSGHISPQHFRHLLEWFGIAVSDDIYYTLLKRFDSVQDGHVNYNQFMRACLQ